MNLFPSIEPYKTERLRVSEIHELHVEQSGNPDGDPILFLHGGPGGGISPKVRELFDPEHYRLIAFDQRGAGKSTPNACLEENTTWDLVKDIEKIRTHLGIEKWKVLGGSWGTTLALSYAIEHPDRVLGLVLRAIFLCRKKDIKWLYQEGADSIFPDDWEDYIAAVNPGKRNDMVSAYYEELTCGDKGRMLSAAQAWSQWEASTSFLHQNKKAIASMGEAEMAIPFARIECHYFSNAAFFSSDRHIEENAHKLRDIPGWIIHGRYDVVCPVNQAWDLHKAWPEAKLKITPTSGHAAFEEENILGQLEALEELKKI